MKTWMLKDFWKLCFVLNSCIWSNLKNDIVNNFWKYFFRCYPKLNEGDQVVMINGRDVSQHTHDQVVNFIRACSEPHSGHLVLVVRQVNKIFKFVRKRRFQKYLIMTGEVEKYVYNNYAWNNNKS